MYSLVSSTPLYTCVLQSPNGARREKFVRADTPAQAKTACLARADEIIVQVRLAAPAPHVTTSVPVRFAHHAPVIVEVTHES